MHYGYWGFPIMGFAGGVLGWIWPILFWVFIAVVISKILRRTPNENEHHEGKTGRQTPLELLKERYVKGEITKKEFEEIKKDIA